jgi:DNA-binding transcriptional LysR family regulator
MEYALGLRLLDRTRQGIEPTMYGRALIRRGQAVFDELRQGVKELEFLADPTAGELRIGSQESIAAGLLPAIIDRFSRQYPRVALHDGPFLAQRIVDVVGVLPGHGLSPSISTSRMPRATSASASASAPLRPAASSCA